MKMWLKVEENEKLKCVFDDKDAHFQNDIRCYCITKENK